MFYCVRLKNLMRWLIAALLFCLITAIIFVRIKPSSRSVSGNAAHPAVLIIDAGHGGLDGGAVAKNDVKESVINLAIAEKLNFLAQFFGTDTLMTRDSEELDYPEELGTIREKKVWDQKRRVELINAVEDGTLISIHQNNYPDPRPNGSQVFYAPAAAGNVLADIMQSLLSETLTPTNRRVAAPVAKNIYLMKNITCPGVLVECGFLSNPTEAASLNSDSYQNKLAIVLLSAYVKYMATTP